MTEQNKTTENDLANKDGSDNDSSKSEPVSIEAATEKIADPVRTITATILLAVVVILIWYLIADRHAPWSDQARVQSYVIPIVPQVSGLITAVAVEKDQIVNAGEILFTIDTSDYQLAVDSAEASLEIAGQDIGAGMAGVVTAQSQLVLAETNRDHINAQSARVFELEKKKVFSVSQGDKARAAIKQGQAQVESAVANLDKAKQVLGVEGDQNPRIRSAMTNLKKAQLDLSRSTILAPAKGGITNLQIDTGSYVNAGSAAMTFIEFENVWIQVNLRENSIANIKIGDPVDIVLDVQPGHIFKGQVSSIGFAVSSSSEVAIGALPSVESETGWLRDAQRFPVMITFKDQSARGLQRLGGQADVQIYTSNNWVINSLGSMWIRLLSWLSYAY